MARGKETEVEAAGRAVRVSSPDKLYFPEAGITKLDLVQYYLAVGDGALRAIVGRPLVLKRFVNGITGDAFFQKRAPPNRPEWLDVVRLDYPSGRSAEEVVVRDLAGLVWCVNLGCIDLNPHAVRADALDRPDELRIDLDPTPPSGWPQIRAVALVVREVLEEHGLSGWPKTSGSRGMHIYARIARRWSFDEVRLAAQTVAREVARRAPEIATARWWKEERRGIFLDYNQNAKDRTIASAYSVRPRPDARVSTPLGWDEVAECEPEAFTLRTVPARVAALGDLAAGLDDVDGSLDTLLALAERHEVEGLTQVEPTPPRAAGTRGRVPRAPLLVISKAAQLSDAQAGLERWRARHPGAAAHLQDGDVLVDSMRGRSTTWTRIRVNLRHVPSADRPPAEPPDPDYDPWAGLRDPRRKGDR